MSKSFESQKVMYDIRKQIKETMLQIVYEKYVFFKEKLLKKIT